MQYLAQPRDSSVKKRITKCRINYTLPLGPETIEALNALRKNANQHREEMLTYQKACGKRGDRDGAKFFKGEASEAMKTYRAACLLIPHFSSEYSGDCKLMDAWDWPPDLFDHIDRVMANAELAVSSSME